MPGGTEGTLILDGLIEGRLPERAEPERLLREWVRSAGSAGLHFSLTFDGPNFSLLAEKTPIPVEDLAPNPPDRISAALEELLKAFDPKQRTGLFSTLRSTEYRKGEAVQVVYGIGAGGTVE
ncbi:hypothetical protein LCGC14_2467780, partial [marine sediment metagenome]